MDRTAFLRSLIDTKGLGLEIGPSYSPVVPKAEGFNVRTLDYLDRAGLRAKYTNAPAVDINRIEEVDYISSGSMVEAIGHRHIFDYIVASHVIEHTPNLIGFLNECDLLLKPGGVLLLAVPDKRYCFDILQPLASTGSAVQASLENRVRPSAGSIFDEFAYAALRSNVIGWSSAEYGPITFRRDIETSKVHFAVAQADPGYTDVHVWRFVPSSFRLIIRDLNDFGFTSLREDQFFDTVGVEFFATLSRKGAGPGIDRLDLARRALAEQAAIPLTVPEPVLPRPLPRRIVSRLRRTARVLVRGHL